MATTGSRLERGAQGIVRRVSGVRWLHAVLLSPPIARPGYWFATLCGLVWGTVLSLGRIRLQGGVVMARKCPRWAFGRGGTTIGAVFLTNNLYSPGVLAHEAAHRAQWKRYGLAFIPLYLAAGRNGTTNRFEIEAGLERGGYTSARDTDPRKVTNMVDVAASISVEEHLSLILADLAPLTPRTVPLGEALRLTLAEDVTAIVDVPGFDNSAMDGYAVHHDDVASATEGSPVVLDVIADLPAGSHENPRIGAGQAARIMTGAAMPDAADYVVPVEDTDGGTTTVAISNAPEGRIHVRLAASDIRAGDLALSAGRVLTSRDIAAAAAVGRSELLVYPAIRVGVISTGSELVHPGEDLVRGQIYDSNSWLLAAAVTELGAVPVRIPAVEDDPEALRATFERIAGTVDAIVTSGGVSVGAYDVVKAVLAPLPTMRFGPVRMQPGKPQGYGRWLDGTPIFTLPGNPVSVFVSFEVFVSPALKTLQGRPNVTNPVLEGVASESWHSPSGRAQYIPITSTRDAKGTLRVRPAARGGSSSHLVASLSGANGIAIIPESVTEVHEGDQLAVTLMASALGLPEAITEGKKR